jgi:zinc/manganese transport system permease protein
MNIMDVMFWPAVACLVLPPLLVYLGLHVVQREVIFVDLAMAQVASFGTCLAIFLGRFTQNGIKLEDPITFWISLAVTFVAATLFSLSRNSAKRHVPQEAVIGITFVVAAAGAILLLSKGAGGADEVQNLLVGDILNVSRSQIGHMTVLFIALAISYAALNKKLALISYAPATAHAQGIRVKLLDFLFYASFGLVVVNFVRMAGVLLTFSYLIVPAVCSVMLADGLGSRLLVGWAVSFVASILGLIASYELDFPPGAAIVCTFGVLLAIISTIVALVRGGFRSQE